MKLLTSIILVFALTCQSVFASSCDWKTGITPGPNHTFIYSEACHLRVGQMNQDLDAANQQIADYQKAITLKDLALTDANSRITTWQNSTFALEDRMSKIDDIEQKNKILYMGLGIVITGLAVWGAGNLVRH